MITTKLKKIKTLKFNTEQITQSVTDLQSSLGDYTGLMKILIEEMVGVEREVYKLESGDLSNGYRPRRALERLNN